MKMSVEIFKYLEHKYSKTLLVCDENVPMEKQYKLQ